MMAIPPNTRSWGKNKERASANGNGGAAGMILSMDMVPTNDCAVAYTVPVQVGSSQQNLSLQVDTGSSDLWIASKSCSSCSGTNGRLYDPGSSQTSGYSITLDYLSGTASGPIVWDQVHLGGYVIMNQVLTAATAVNDEPLSYNFDGILGLALPSNSLIQQVIPTNTGDAPDGATVSSNLFLAANAPAQPFFSLTLARPGFSQTQSLLGIGRHPPEIVPDPSRINYSSLSSENGGSLYWKTTVRAITVYVDGQAHPVALQSLSGAPEPTALLDSGLPVIMTTPILADGIYGALGINPAADGQYYVPCATPLNMTITLDGQPELALHPLDLTVEPSGQSSAQYCTGLVQTDPAQLTAASGVGDMILGVPFLRSVYAVLAYQRPDASGTINMPVQLGVDPTLGLLGLTNATQALADFHQVRVLREPPGSGPSSSSGPKEAGVASTGQLSIGLKILIGLVGFFALCIALFGLRCLVGRRRRGSASEKAAAGEYGGYHRTRSSADQHTLVDASPRKVSHDDEGEEDWDVYGFEFGLRKAAHAQSDLCDPWDPYSGTWRDTIVGTEAGEAGSLRCSSHDPLPDFADADADVAAEHVLPEGDLDVALLTAHDRGDSTTTTEFGAFSTGGMAGIGTVARGSVIDPDLRYRPSVDSVSTLWPTVVSWRSSHALARDSDDILFEEV